MQQTLRRASLGYAYPVSPSLYRGARTLPGDSYAHEWPLSPTRGRIARLQGLGATTAQEIGAGAGAAAGVAQIIMSSTVGGKVSGAGSVILSSAPLAGPYAPAVAIAGAVVMAAGQIMTFLHIGDGCGQSCILTSEWADKAETLLRANIDAYFSSTVRLTTSRDEALRGFDMIWGQLAQACGQVHSAAGVNCTGDRQAGACHYHQTGESPWPGGPKLGECWNWFAAYRDPIAHDTQAITPEALAAQLQTQADVTNGTSTGAGILGGLDSKTMLMLAGVALVALGAMGD